MALQFHFQFQLRCQLHGNSNHNFFSPILSPLPLQQKQQQRRRQLLHSRLVLRCSSSNIDSNGGSNGGRISSSTSKKVSIPNSNYVVPLDKSPFSSSYSSCITRPLAEILRDLNKRIPDSILLNSPRSSRDRSSNSASSIPWYHANRMLSFYAPGWCGEVRDVIYSENGSVTVVYRVTIRGSDGEAYQESTGTVLPTTDQIADLAAAAEEIAFCRTCARFGLGLYLYHEE